MNNEEKDLETPCPYHSIEKYGQCNNPSNETTSWYCVHNKHCVYKQRSKYKNALKEIRDIAEENLNVHTCAFKGCGYDLITSQILQKINEVENE